MNDRSRSAAAEVLIVRDFAAPRALVFAAWSSAAHLQRWYAPSGCTLAHCAVDFRPGGALRFCIRPPASAAGGHDCWVSGTFREIVRPARLVYTMVNTDAEGRVLPPAALGMDPEWPGETTVTVTFAELADARTRLTLHQDVSETVAKRTGAHPSWLSMLDRLAGVIAG